MAVDPIIGEFHPSVAVPVARRRPLADHLRGEWDLQGVKPHTGALPLGDLSLMPTERRLLAELVRAHEGDGLEPAWRFQDALNRVHIDGDLDYWICSLMVKLGTSSVMGLVQMAQADPSILKSPESGEQFLPRPGMIGGRLAGV